MGAGVTLVGAPYGGAAAPGRADVEAPCAEAGAADTVGAPDAVPVNVDDSTPESAPEPADVGAPGRAAACGAPGKFVIATVAVPPV